MIKNYYTYKNDKVGIFLEPFMIPNPKDNIKELILNSVKMGNKPDHAEELSLYYLGSMDDKTGVFVSNVEFICSLSEAL